MVPLSVLAQETLKDSVQTIDEISVSKELKTFSTQNGNIKIDVTNSIYKSIPDVLELLSRLPKVQISPDRESISVIGKGNPLVYIDNARADMNALSSLSTDDIKSIELIQNPSARYEANGQMVILITRKWRKSEGFQATFSETASAKKRFNNFLGTSANLKSGKTELRANVNYNRLNPWESNSNDYVIEPAAVASDYLIVGISKRHQIVYGASLFRQLQENDYISLTINGKSQQDNFGFDTRTFNADDGIENRLKTVGNDLDGKNFVNSVLNYNNKFSESKANFFIGLQYARLYQRGDLTSQNDYNDTGFSPFQANRQEFEVDSFTARSDFEKTFSDQLKLETGILVSSTHANNKIDITNFEQTEITRSSYDLNERIFSGYAQLSGKILKLDWQVGIRAENTDALGKYEAETNPLVDRNYTNWFPKAQLEIPIDSLKSITLNYAKFITRPDYSSLNQGVTYANPYFMFAGNINLKPSVADEVSANFQYRDKSLRVSYRSARNNVNYSFVYDASRELLILRPENFDREFGYVAEMTLPFTHKNWTTTNVLSVNLNEIQDEDAVYNAVKPFLYYYSNHIFKLKKDWTVSATGWGLTKRYQGIIESRAVVTLDASVSKTLKNWTLTFSANDIFKGMNFRERFSMASVSTVGNYYGDAHEFSIVVKYSFGKIKDSKFEEKAVNETDRIR